MNTYFVVSDIHGFYSELMKALDEAGFDISNENHIIINLGDATDRGPDNIKVLNFLMDLYDKNRAILIRGNHEDLMEEAISRGYFESHDRHNCTDQTACELTHKPFVKIDDFDGWVAVTCDALMDMKTNELWKRYIQSTIDYYETEDYIFVHGWIPCFDNWGAKGYFQDDWREPIWKNDWKEARWLNGMDMWSRGIVVEGKTIFCGHWHCSWGNAYLHNKGSEWDKDNFEPFKDEGICAIDACTAFSGKVNCIRLGVDDDN